MKSKLTLFLALSLIFTVGPGLPGHSPPLHWQVVQAQQQKKVALVIGNKDYTSSPLQNPLNDARDMSAKLKKLGFSVISRENLPDEKAMKRALLDAAEQIQPGGVFLFYYSGHGMQVRGTNYLIPTQAQIRKEKDVEFEGLDFNRVLGEIEAGKASVNIVLLDACRDNPFGSGFKSISKGLAGITQSPAGTFIGFATAPGGVSSDNVSGRNGLFTGELLKHLDTPGLKIEDIFKRTAKGVQTREKQTPWSNSSLTDDFYFIPPGSTPVSTPPSAAPQEPAVPVLNYTVAEPECVSCPNSGKVGENLTFQFKMSYGGPEQVRAVVDWGDGSSQSIGGWLTDSGVSTLAHRYSRGGQYTLQVRGWTTGGKKSAGSLRQGVTIAALQPTPTPIPIATSRPTTPPARVPVSVPPTLNTPVQPDQQAQLLLLQAENHPNPREIYAQCEALALSAEMKKEVQKQFFGYLAQTGEFREIVDRSFEPIVASAKAQDRNTSTALYAELLRWLGKSSNLDVDQAYLLKRMEGLYEQYPKDSITRQQLISHYQRNDQPEKLLALYRQELITQGNQLDAKEQAQLFGKIADLHLQRGYLQFAYDNYLRASDKDPTDIHSRLRLGIIYITAKDYREASRSFEKLLKEQPLLHEARLYQAFAEAFNQEPDKAKQILAGLPASFEPELQGWLRSLIANPKIEPVNEIWKRLLPEYRIP